METHRNKRQALIETQRGGHFAKWCEGRGHFSLESPHRLGPLGAIIVPDRYTHGWLSCSAGQGGGRKHARVQGKHFPSTLGQVGEQLPKGRRSSNGLFARQAV